MTPVQFTETWLPIVLELAAAGLALAAFTTIVILATRHITNMRWRREIITAMPAHIQEQLLLRDQRIKEQGRELGSLRERVRKQDAALRAVHQITWQAGYPIPDEEVPRYPQMAKGARG